MTNEKTAMSRRSFGALGAAAAAAAMAPQARAQAPGLSFMSFSFAEEANKALVQKLADDFSAANSIPMQVIGSAWGDVQRNLMLRQRSKTLPTSAQISERWLPSFAGLPELADLNELVGKGRARKRHRPERSRRRPRRRPSARASAGDGIDRHGRQPRGAGEGGRREDAGHPGGVPGRARRGARQGAELGALRDGHQESQLDPARRADPRLGAWRPPDRGRRQGGQRQRRHGRGLRIHGPPDEGQARRARDRPARTRAACSARAPRPSTSTRRRPAPSHAPSRAGAKPSTRCWHRSRSR